MTTIGRELPHMTTLPGFGDALWIQYGSDEHAWGVQFTYKPDDTDSRDDLDSDAELSEDAAAMPVTRTTNKIFLRFCNRDNDHVATAKELEVVVAVLEQVRGWSTKQRWENLVQTCSGEPSPPTIADQMHVAAFVRPPTVVGLAVDAEHEALLVMCDNYMEDPESAFEVEDRRHRLGKVLWGARTREFLKRAGKSVTFRPIFTEI